MKRWIFIFGAAAVLFLAGFVLLEHIPAIFSAKAEAFSCRLKARTRSIQSYEGRSVIISIQLKNTGKKAWLSEGKHPVFLSYHLMDSVGYCLQYDNRRYAFPERVHPKESITLPVVIKIPLQPGKFMLVFDLVREGIAWFEDYGSRPLEVSLEISPNPWADIREDDLLAPGSYTYFTSLHPGLNDMYKLIRLTLEENEVSFQGQDGPVSAFAAGSDYPQVWLRDAQTILPVSQYFYGREFLSSWIEEHLRYQSDDGSLSDWFDSQGRTDKNTTETDQEASAVLAAWQVFRLLGTGWLETEINGDLLVNRLERALDYVLAARLDPKTGLLKGAHTADWGDVDMIDQDQEAVYTDERTLWTSDIYDQSIFYDACLKLSQMLFSLNQQKRAERWKNTARSLRQKTDEQLWQEKKGFYRVHLHLTSLRHDFDEDEMFALGGNTQAVLSGLAGGDKAARIIRHAQERQRKFQIPTISAVLLPPYPEDVFRHPALDDPFEYQNGAQWDWFGGRTVSAMFQNGFSRDALDRLLEIAEKNRNNRGFYEWDTRDGVGMGSDLFCGSAGVLGQAVIEGYYGIRITGDTASLSPRLGKDAGKIHVFIPALKKYIAYEYRFDSEHDRILMDVNSDHGGKGMIRILSPWETLVKEDLSLMLNGEETEFRLETLQNDVFIVFEARFPGLHIEISRS